MREKLRFVWLETVADAVRAALPLAPELQPSSPLEESAALSQSA